MRYKKNEKYSVNINDCDTSKQNHKNLQMADVRTAKELKYPARVIDALKHEPDQFKRQRILCNARNGYYN